MKIPTYIALLALQLAIAGTACAAQLWYSVDDLPDSFPQPCRVALSQNITCSELISGSKVAGQQLYRTSELNEYCTSSCADSLRNFQQDVQDGCGDAVLTYNTTSTTGAQLAYPLAWAYNVTCLQDNNGFCNPQLFNGSSTLSMCSECVLSYMARMLESEYGRSRFSDEGFASQLSSCGVPTTSYPYTTPTSTKTATTSTGSVSASPTSTGQVCPGDSYTVDEADTCESIAAANSIPLGTFLADNSIDQNCTTLRTGSEVCLSPACSLYTVTDGDTCKSITAGRGYYMNQFLSWNPTIHKNCDNLLSMLGQDVCISPPGTTEWDVVTTNRTPTMTFTMFPGDWETGPAPTQVMTSVSYPAIPTNFTTVTVTATINQTEQNIIDDYMKYCPISAADYDQGFQWIDLSDDCQELLDPYCQPDPDSASPTSTTFPTFCIPGNASATTTTEPPTPTATVPSPTMPGTMSGCTKYHLVTSDDSCQALADDYNISISDLIHWNSGVGEDCRTLKTEYYVCVGRPVSSTTPTASPSTTPGPATPSPTMEGTTSNCNNYHIVVSGDQCGTMAAEYGISLADFYTWNPGVGDDCSTLKVDYYVCVGVKVPTPSSTTTTTAAATTAMSSGGSVPSPTQSGLTSSCKKYHEVINGDGCYDLATAYGIALSEFYSWNPAVGDDCSVLQSGYYVCVGI